MNSEDQNSASQEADLPRHLHLWIDTYDDLFSDFDPRPFTERIISDDFIVEMNKLTAEHDEHIKSICFQIPKAARDEGSEKIIRKRLIADFQRQYRLFSRSWSLNCRVGIIIVAGGLTSLALAVFVAQTGLDQLAKDIVKVVLEPAGWFMMWTGLDKVAFGGRASKRKRDFYRRLSKSKVEFVSI